MSSHIMVFDDDDTMQDMFVALLEDEGYKVTVQRAPTVTVAEVERTNPDLIIVDWMGGQKHRAMHLIQSLAAHRPTAGIPIVACSIETLSKAEQAKTHVTREIGVVRKPFALDDLMSVVANQLANSGGCCRCC